MGLRDIIFRVLPERTKRDWSARAMANDVGFTGHGKTPIDCDVKPLGKFAAWLLAPAIAEVAAARRDCWREAVMEVTGEDPEADPYQDWGY